MSAANDKNGIVWIASYPKSGNTWLRLLLGNYFYAQDNQAFTINNIQNVMRGDTSSSIYQTVCEDEGWKLEDAVNDIQKHHVFFERYIKGKDGVLFLKTHNFFHSEHNVPYFAKSFTKGFIGIVRDPRDVLCSYARHLGHSIDETLGFMSDKASMIETPGNKTQHISSWDNHVNSFADTGFPTMIIRYEDLSKNTSKILGHIVQTITGKVDQAQLDFAVKNAQFKVLKKQEEKEGFSEASDKADKFFHSGTSGGWREILSDKQVQAVEQRFEKTMKNLRYL